MRNRLIAIIMTAFLLLSLSGCDKAAVEETSDEVRASSSQESSAIQASASEPQISSPAEASSSNPKPTPWELEALEQEYLDSLFPADFTPELKVAELAAEKGPVVTVRGSSPVAGAADRFDGGLFRRQSFDRLCGDNAIFFLAGSYGLLHGYHLPGDLLYYEPGQETIRLLENVSSITAVDEHGIYVIRNLSQGENTPSRADYKAIAGNRLLYYTPMDGNEKYLLENVCSAYPVPDSTTIYYVAATPHDIPEEEQYNRDFILQLRRFDTATGTDTVLFTDNGMQQSKTYPVWYAFDAFFTEGEEGLELLLYYPYESEVPAWRILTLNPDTGAILTDNNPYEMHFDKIEEGAGRGSRPAQSSDTDDQAMEGLENTDPLYSVKQSIQRKEYDAGSYTVIAESTSREGYESRINFYRKDQGDEVYLGTGGAPIVSENGYFTFGAGGTTWLYGGGRVLYSLQGNWLIQSRRAENSRRLSATEGPSIIAESWPAKTNCYTLSGSGDAVSLRLLYEIESFPSGDVEDGPGRFTDLLGDFLLFNTNDNGCILVCHVPSGEVRVVNGDGMMIRTGRQDVS